MAREDPEKARRRASEWYWKHRDETCGARRKERAENPEGVCAADRARYAKNPEKKRKSNFKYREANREKIREGANMRHAERREEKNTRQREYRAANPEKHRETNRKWAKANPEKVIEISRRNTLKRKYNLTPAQYDAMSAAQRGHCKTCGRDDQGLHVDHDHATGMIRGLLCGNCNRMIGLAGDNPAVLRKAANYLEV